MGADFLVAFTLMNGVYAFPSGIFETPKQRVPRIRQTWRAHAELSALRDIAVAYVWTPMQIRTIQKDQAGWFRGRTQIGIRHIMTG